MNNKKVIELFAGLGAYSKALTRLNINHKVVVAIEFDDKTIHSYNLLHNTNYEPVDITTLDEKSLPDCDVICYSPPCQAFSVAGKQLGFDDKRGILFFDALRIIKEKKPKYCIMENVKGLTQKKFKEEFKVMLNDLQQVGYKNYWKVLNAKDYGIPQNRERVFIVSIRNDIEQEFEFPDPIPLKYQLKDILEEDAELPIIHNIYGGFKETQPRVFNDYSPTIRTSAGGGHIPSVYIVEDFYKNREVRAYKNYAPTLRSGRKGLKVVNNRLTRQLTTLEAFRLMGYDDKDYNLLKDTVSNTQLYKMAGNSIVVNVLEEIFKKLFLKEEKIKVDLTRFSLPI